MMKNLRSLTLVFAGTMIAVSALAQKPNASFIVSNPYVCEGQNIRFVNSSTGHDSIFWEMGNGDTSHSEKFDYTYDGISTNEQTFTVTLYAFKGNESDTFDRDILVQAQATAYFRDSIIATWVQFFHECENYLGLSWDFGDGQTSISDNENISHFYTKEGTYDVVLIANTEYQCNDTFRKRLVLIDSTGDGVGEKNPYKMEVYPNPFNDLSIFAFELNQSNDLRLSISDALGKVYFYERKSFSVGRNELNLAEILGDAGSGVYFISITDNDATYILKAHKD